ncbi:MAG: hypothetical protein H0X26_08860 [Alphaproteobacteria bacterium]|nr:hypothetical protein [Alphaproteobacteria bacterium]
MNHLKNYLLWLCIVTLAYSSSCLAMQEFTEEAFTTFTKKIGYQFKDRTLLSNALTHSSVPRKETEIDGFQRLEWLGDSTLNQVITDYLFDLYPEGNEGLLTQKRKELIRNSYVLKVSEKLNLIKDVMYQIDQPASQKGLNKISYTACEALIGAINRDGGSDCAKDFILTHFISNAPKQSNNIKTKKNIQITSDQQPTIHTTANTDLPFKTLKEFRKLCEYKIITPAPSYTSMVRVGEKTYTGKAPSIQRAKRVAAKTAYEDLKKTTVGKKNAILTLEKAFPKKVSYSPITCSQSKEAEIEASYNGITMTEKGASSKQAKTEVSKKLFECVKSLSEKGSVRSNET